MVGGGEETHTRVRQALVMEIDLYGLRRRRGHVRRPSRKANREQACSGSGGGATSEPRRLCHSSNVGTTDLRCRCSRYRPAS